MAVAFDAQGHSVAAATTATSVSGTPITVGSGANRALCVGLSFGGTAGLPTGITVTWDVGGTAQAMTAVTGATGSNTNSATSIIWYALKAPTSGAKTLTASWTGGRSCVMGAASFTGVDQTGGNTSFAHGTGGSGATTTATITVTSATGNFTIGMYNDDGGTAINSTSATQDFIDGTAGGQEAAMNHTAGTASNTMTATLAASDQWAAAGFDIVAAGGAAPTIGWDNLDNDIFPPRRFGAESAPAWTPPFTIAKISGMAWFEPPDATRVKPSITIEESYGYHFVPAVGVSGIAWFEPPESGRVVQKTSITVEPAYDEKITPAVGNSGIGWFEPWDVKIPQRISFSDISAYNEKVPIVTSTISGMAWFEPWDVKIPQRVSFSEVTGYNEMPPFVVNSIGWFDPPESRGVVQKISFSEITSLNEMPIPAVGVSGIGWFEPWDQIKVKPSITIEESYGYHFIPAVGISGIGWFEPPDQPRRPPISIDIAPVAATSPPTVQAFGWFTPLDTLTVKAKVKEDPPPFGSVITTPVGISGIAWFEPPDRDKPAKVNFLTDPIYGTFFVPQITIWSIFASETLVLRDPPRDETPGFGYPVVQAFTPISGMSWFEPWDQIKVKPSITIEASYGYHFVPAVGISGIGWFDPPDQTMVKPSLSMTEGVNFNFIPAVGISGIGWFEPPDRNKPVVKVFFDSLPSQDIPPPTVQAFGWFTPLDLLSVRAKVKEDSPPFGQAITTPVGISGIAWFEPRDIDQLPKGKSFQPDPVTGLFVPQTVTWGIFASETLILRDPPRDETPSFGYPSVAAVSTIAGMAWFEPRDIDQLPKGKFLTDPVTGVFVPQTTTWSYFIGDTVFLRDPPKDTSPGFGYPVVQAFTPISGMSWFEPPDVDKVAVKSKIESLASIALTPATLPVGIRGMAWFEPPPGSVKVSFSVSESPALQQPIVQLPPPVAEVIYNVRFISNMGTLMNHF